MLRTKSFSIINLAGLTIGITTFIAIALYVADEFSYDAFHQKKDRIYRAIITASFDGQTHRWAAVPNQVAPTAAREIPEIEKAVRLFHHNFGDIAFITTTREKFSEQNLFYTDPEFFEVFDITFVAGSVKNALDRPGTVILSETAAKKYFGEEDPIGQTITVDNRINLEVTGVYADFPSNSFLQCQLIASFTSHTFGQPDQLSWGNASFDTFFLLQPQTTQQVAEQKIAQMLSRSISEQERWFSIQLQRLTDIRLYSGDLNALFDRREYGDIEQVRILAALAIIILVIASVNYMNLTTAQSQKRNKEVGISKTLGATHTQLKGKFYFEASVFVFFALSISALLFSFFLRSPFNSLTGKNISLYFLASPWFWSAFIGLWLLLTFLSGFYPAMYLSSFSPKAVLQRSPTTGGQTSLRKALVVVQFSASVILIISSIVFYKQMSYVRNKKLGYQPEQVIAIMTSGTRDQNLISSLKTEIESLAGVKSVCRSQSYPGIGTSGYSIIRPGDTGRGASIATARATNEVLDVLGIKLLAGKTLPAHKDSKDTTTQIVINKSTADYLQWTPEEAVGKSVVIFNGQPSEIAGVVEDFHYNSLHQQIGLYCFNNNEDNAYIYLLVKVESSNISAMMSQLEQTFRKIIPASFEYAFIDQQMAKLYQSEEKLSQVVLLAAGIAIFIACLGLYALAAYTVDQRIKEIGIRKVLGASVPHLVTLVSKDFMLLIGFAFLLGMPLAYYLMERWLQGFAYRTNIDVVIFATAGLVTLVIASLTVSIESVKAATHNPVNSLKSE